jgi:serine/threonine-protein kinase
MIGQTVSHYHITGKLGAGGMGEVYRARDSKLNRDVAIKVLPEGFAQDAERVARFQREAQVLASLNHPNIAAIYGLEESDGIRALVMELVEGPTLADRIAAGPIPVNEALAIAKQIAEALEVAHERGIIHRDLKPANVKVTPDDKVKVLDFGLAKISSNETPSDDLSHSPTMIKGTQAGMILGTAAYMSPEQAKGKIVDKRADIWAFGCLLFEMLSGKQSFSGETLTDTLAAVVRAEPDWDALPATTPDAIRRLLRRCLTKDQKKRLRDIGEASIQIEKTISGEADESAGDIQSHAQSHAMMMRASRRLRLLPWAIAAVAIVATGLTIGQRWTRNPDASRPVKRFVLAPTAPGRLTSVLLSPDGTRLISTVRVSGRGQLFERLLSAPDARPIEGSEGAIDPFFSPDGKFVAFFANGLLKKVSLSGGAPETICKAQNDRGAVWGADDSIVFAPGTDVPLYRARASGGPAEVISTLDVSARERSHRWPDVLPDGKSILFTVAYEVGNPLDDASIAVLDLATGKHKTIIKSAGFARYSPTGHIVYARHGGITAVPFNAERLEVTGPPVTFPENVLMSVTNGGAQFSFSRNGDLAYVVGRSDDSRDVGPLVWLDRRGREEVLSEAHHKYSTPRLTSDGRTLLVEIGDSGAAIWSYNLDRGTLSPLTLAGVSYNPMPAPDGKRVAYEAVRDGVAGVLLARLDGSGEERLTATKRLHIPTSWTPDGKTLAITGGSDSGFLEVWLVPVDGDRKPQTFLQGPFNVGGARFSPDGRWVAYVSDESGRNEVYVRRYPESGTRIQISADGGGQPVWARNGRELFFRNGDELLAVDVALQGDFTAGRPRLLFSRYNPQSESGLAYDLDADYDVSLDGQRFVIPKRVLDVSNTPTGGVVLNWFEELRRLAPTN